MTEERRRASGRAGRALNRRRWDIAAAGLLAGVGLLVVAPPARARANLQVSPGILDFGGVPVGGSATQSFTLVNAASIPLSSTSTIGITGNLPGSEFTIQSGSVSPIPPFGSVTWNLTFHPTQVETFNNLFIDFADPNSTTVRVTVRGFSAGPTFSVNSSSLSFGQVPVGQVKLRVVTVSNTGTGVLHVNNLQLSGSTPGDFQAQFSGGGGTAAIPDGSSAAINVTFAPGAAGARGAQLEIDDDAGGPHFVDLSGTGVGPPASQLIVSPDVLDFGAVNVGSSLTLGFTLKNIGNGPTGNIQVASNLSSSQFTIPVNSVSPIAPAISTTWSVTFHPTTAGIVSGSIRFADPNGGAGSTLVTVGVQGRGVAPPPSQLVVSPGTLDFGAVNVGDRSTLTLMLSNIGSGPTGTIQVAGNLPASQFTIQSASISPLTPGGPPTTWSVTYHPTTAGIVSGFLRFTDPNGGTASTQVLVNVLGRGAGASPAPPQISVSPGTLDFGAVSVGQQSAKSFTVSNTGGSDLQITGVENDLDGTEFSINGSGASAPLHPGSSQTWTVTFHPTKMAAYDTSIALDHNAAGSPTRVFIKVTAVPAGIPTPTGPPTITGYAATNPKGVRIASGPPGAPLLILGNNFGAGGTVAFNGIPAGAALSWSATEIVATIPMPPSYPFSGPVTVTVNGQTATGPPFTILAPANPTPTPSPGVTGTDWPVFMQGPGQPGRAGFTVDARSLSMWSVTLGSKPGVSPVMAAGVAYIGTESTGIFAVDTATHQERWNRQLGAPVRGAPAIGRQAIVVAAGNGLYGLNPQDGTVRWPRPDITSFATVSPMIVGDTVYIGGPGPGGFGSALYAVNAITGANVWPAPASLPAAALSTVAADVDRGLLFVAMGQQPASGQPATAPSAVLALRLSDGSPAWPSPAVLPIPAPAGLSLGQVGTSSGSIPAVFVAAGSTVTALNATNGMSLWSRSLPETRLQAPPVVSSSQPGATLYVAGSGGHIYALSADSGADVAGARASDVAPTTGTLLLAGKLLFAPTSAGLVALDLTTGAAVWTGDAPGGSGVAAAGNSLLIGTADGRLVGFSGTAIALP